MWHNRAGGAAAASVSGAGMSKGRKGRRMLRIRRGTDSPLSKSGVIPRLEKLFCRKKSVETVLCKN